jgi:hypothetical protein
VSFIAFNEIPTDLMIEPVSIIHYSDIFDAEPAPDLGMKSPPTMSLSGAAGGGE